MENQQAGYLKQLQTLFGALFVGQILVTVIFYFFLTQPQTGESTTDVLETILPLVMLSTTILGYFIFNLRRKTWTQETNLDAKKAAYRTASLVKLAMFEGTTILGLMCYFAFGKDLFFFAAVVSIAHFALHFPSRERVVRELETDNVD